MSAALKHQLVSVDEFLAGELVSHAKDKSIATLPENVGKQFNVG